MKIALINSLYKPYRRGGAEVVFANIVKELKKDGHDVFVITISGKKEKKFFFVSLMDDVRIYRFYPKNIFSFIDINTQPIWKRLIWHVIDMFNWHSYRQVKKILKIEKPELVLSHNLKGLGYLTLKAVRSLKIKNIHTLHDVQFVNQSGLIIKGQEKQGALNYIFAQLTKLLIDSPEFVISPSKWLFDFYKPYGFFRKSREIVLPNPLILEPIDYKKTFDDKTINYLFLGQLEEHKGIKFLLEVFAEFAKTNQAKLYVVGTGRLENELKAKYGQAGWVDFRGYIPANLLSQQIFKNVHYAVLPSLCYENSPTLIYDSFNCATPVIAAAIGGIPELVREGVNGYLFEAGNKASLRNKLRLSFEQVASFSKMSENAKIKARDFDIKNYVYKILSL